MAWWLQRDGGLPDAPKQVQLIISDLCNQDCHFCAYRLSGYTSNELFTEGAQLSKYGHNNPKRMIPVERALSLLEEMKDAGVLAVQFTGGGEPTVHPRHLRIFHRALEVGLACSLVSNGLRWSDDLISMLHRFSWVRVSVDAGTARTYQETRRTSPQAFSKVLAHTRALAAQIDQANSECALGVGYVITPENWKEIVDGVYLAKAAGAHNVRLSAAFTPEDEKPYQDIAQHIRPLIAEAKEKYEDDTFKVIDNFGLRLSDLVLKSPDYDLCAKQHYCAYIGADLRAYRCCVYAYNKYGFIMGGNLREQSFKDFWGSDARKMDFGVFQARKCERCQFREANHAMAYLLQDQITHGEFP